MEYTNLNENSPQAEQPNKIKIKMKHHQLASLYYANKLETENYFYVDDRKIETSIGVIADKAREFAAVPVTAVNILTSFSNNSENLLFKFFDHLSNP